MIPLRDVNPTRSTAFVNGGLIIVNILFFFWEVSLGPRLPAALDAIALVPARFWGGGDLAHGVLTIFTSMFLHGGWLHLGGNMLYLWIFGDNIEDRLGHFRYLLFYLACGVAASLAHAIANPASRLPSVGASGAIAGVLGAYLVLFPSARVMTFIPIGFYIALHELPAILVLGLWFAVQLFTGVASLQVTTAQDVGGVAWFAHIGGFVAGVILILLFGRGRRSRQVVPMR
ncbi:MAG TPA: rhomboid family intramembrane serine protease [Thermoanaerobaculia bacterium]|nr:rhomboid family intramembrane serine protease [Thermoanaerobaculia bacterium]